MKNILGLDLGSSTGYCYNIGPAHHSGTITWAADKELKDMRKQRFDRRGDIRVIRFFSWLQRIPKVIDHVVIEDVRFHTSLAQSQLWSSFRTAVWLAFPATKIETLDVGALKKFATGSGAADKLKMKAYLEGIHPALYKTDLDDNAIDAIWLWVWAKRNLAKEPI